MAETKKPAAAKKPATAAKSSTAKSSKFHILGLTTCPTGVAHTMMAADAIEKWAKSNGHSVKVERQAQIGTLNELTEADIAKADYIIIAAGKAIEKPERFAKHPKVLRVGVEAPIHDIESTMKQMLALDGSGKTPTTSVKAVATAVPQKKQSAKFLQPLLAGISYMIPVVVLGGIFLGVSFAFAGEPTLNGLVIPNDTIWGGFMLSLNQIGGAAFTFVIPLLAMMIANAIAGRSAMAPAAALALWANSGPAFFNYANIGDYGGDAITLLGHYFTPETTLYEALTTIGTATLGFDIDNLSPTEPNQKLYLELGNAWNTSEGNTMTVGYVITINDPSITLAELNDPATIGYTMQLTQFVYVDGVLDESASNNPFGAGVILDKEGGDAVLTDTTIQSYYELSTGKFQYFGGFSTSVNQGFLGSILIGYFLGFLIKAWNDAITLNKTMAVVMPIVVIPLFFGFVGWAMMSFIGYVPLYAISVIANQAVLFMTNHGLIVVMGFILGMMIGFDMGGPVNKLAFLFGVATIASDTRYMGMITVAIAVPPIGCAIGVGLGKAVGVKFDDEDKSAATSAGIMGFVGITEGAIPFAAKYPSTVFAANMIGSGVAGALCGLLGITSIVAHGGPYISLIGGIGTVDSAAFVAQNGAVPAGSMLPSIYPAGLLSIVVMLIGCMVHAIIFAFGELALQNKRTRSKELTATQKAIKSTKNEELISKSANVKSQLKANVKVGIIYDGQIGSKSYFEGQLISLQVALDKAQEAKNEKLVAKSNANIVKTEAKIKSLEAEITTSRKNYDESIKQTVMAVDTLINAIKQANISGIDLTVLEKDLKSKSTEVFQKYGITTVEEKKAPVSKTAKAAVKKPAIKKA